MKKISLLLISIIVISFILAIDIYKSVSNHSVLAGDFNDEHFMVLLFPVVKDSDLLLQRAYIVTLKEYGENVVGVYGKDGEEVKVDKESLSVFPPESVERLVRELNIEIVKWGEGTDWEAVNYEYEIVGGVCTVSLKVQHKSGDYAVYGYCTGSA